MSQPKQESECGETFAIRPQTQIFCLLNLYGISSVSPISKSSLYLRKITFSMYGDKCQKILYETTRRRPALMLFKFWGQKVLATNGRKSSRPPFLMFRQIIQQYKNKRYLLAGVVNNVGGRKVATALHALESFLNIRVEKI